MKRNIVFLGVSLFILALAALYLPTVASAQAVAYRAVIQVQNSSGTPLGYVATDPNYWTPLLTPDVNSALVVAFTLNNGQTGTGINLTTENSGRSSFPLLGLVVGRDSTDSNIAPGSFNYLYLDDVSTPGTPPDSTPQSIPSFFSTSTGLDKQAETAVWSIAVTGLTGTLSPVWVNSDESTPPTQVFIQSNHVYAGGDASAFNARFPAPVTVATLHLVILSSEPLDPDGDGDGIPDKDDECPNTPENDIVNANGCSIDQLCPCANNWKNHGAYVSCVSNAAEDFVADDLITAEEEDAIVSEAAQSSCGKKK